MIRSISRRHLLGCLVAVAAGCSASGVPVAADEEKARQLLVSTLDAWKGGDSVDKLKAASPSVIVEDLKWKRGDQLAKYEIAGDGKPSGSERAFTVKLFLKDAKGKESREEVVYKVGTDPISTVFRSLF